MPGQTGIGGEGPGTGPVTFNGGPGNCPAKQYGGLHRVAIVGPSMEGRAIARPNFVQIGPADFHRCSFNGGPGNCPAKPPPS